MPTYDGAVDAVRDAVVRGTSNCARSILGAVEFGAAESKTNILVRLRDEEDYTAQFVHVAFKCVIFVLVLVFRCTILRYMWKVVTFVIKTPLQIMWFFCPLRLVVGSSSKSSKSGKDKMGSGSGTGKGSGISRTTKVKGVYKNGASGSIVKL